VLITHNNLSIYLSIYLRRVVERVLAFKTIGRTEEEEAAAERAPICMVRPMGSECKFHCCSSITSLKSFTLEESELA
jgi:hypothetical protein